MLITLNIRAIHLDSSNVAGCTLKEFYEKLECYKIPSILTEGTNPYISIEFEFFTKAETEEYLTDLFEEYVSGFKKISFS